MSRQDPVDRWPYALGGEPAVVRSYEPGGERSTATLVEAAASALDEDPLALPTLNERVDPDYLDGVASTVADSPAGTRLAVEATLEDATVLLRDDGRIAVYTGSRGDADLHPMATVDHDWRNADSLVQSIARAVAALSEDDLTTVTARLIERIGTEAVERLLAPLGDGSDRRASRLYLSADGYEITVEPDGHIAVEPSLTVLKRTGVAVLVAGAVPGRALDRAAATLLGGPEETARSIIALHGRDLETARRRLSMAGIPSSSATVFDHQVTARGASAAGSSAGTSVPPERDPEVVSVSGGVDTLPEAVRGAVTDARTDGTALRLCVGSLRSMIEASDTGTTCDVVESLSRLVRETGGIGQFLLPEDPEDTTVSAFVPLVDAVLEVRTTEVGVEQRWRLTGTGHESAWFPLR